MNEYKTKEYHRTKAQEHYAANKATYSAKNAVRRNRTRDLINAAKVSGCLKCPERDLSCLDFHHVHGKDMRVSAMLGMNDIRVQEEIAKCVVLCANCHRKHHAGVLSL